MIYDCAAPTCSPDRAAEHPETCIILAQVIKKSRQFRRLKW
jgi:hypothetical protein